MGSEFGVQSSGIVISKSLFNWGCDFAIGNLDT